MKFIKESNSVKWGAHIKNDCFAMQLADMDFAFPFKEHLSQSLSRVNNLTYKQPDFTPVLKWYSNRCRAQDIIQAPSVNTLLFFSIFALTQPNDGILLMSPVYMTYHQIIASTRRRVVDAPLLRVQIDRTLFTHQVNFAAIQQKCAKENNVRMLVVCNPHNPGGRVWGEETLSRIARICQRNQIVIFSDEICGDLSHSSFHSMIEAEGRVIVGNSISKAFNSSSTKGGYGIVRHKETRKKIYQLMTVGANVHLSELTLLLYPILYSEGGRKWLASIKEVILVNYNYALKMCYQNKVMIQKLEGSYGMQFDFRNYSKEIQAKGISIEAIMNKFGIILRHSDKEYADRRKNYQMRASIAVQHEYFKRFMLRMAQVINYLQQNKPKL